MFGKYRKRSQPASSQPDEAVFASQACASFASSSHGDSSCDTTTSSEGSSSSSSSDEGHAPAAEAAAAAAAAVDPPSEDEVVRPAKREPLSPLPVAQRSPAAKRHAAARPSPTPPQPSVTQPTPPPSPPAGAWQPPTPLYLPSPPEGLYAAGGEEIARAARREADIEGALEDEVRARADAPHLRRMQEAGVPKTAAARALELARAAVEECGPAAGKMYVAGLKSQISELAKQLVSTRDALDKANKACAEWRRAAMGAGGEA